MAEHPSTNQAPVLITKTIPGITTITINRPQRRNAIDDPTAQKLTAAFLTFEEDPTQKVIPDAGANFRSGNRYAAHVVSPSNHVQGRNRGPIGPSRMQLTKPVIAAVSGHAVAGGLELALLANICVVEEDAVFGVFCRRFGVPLIDGGTVRLQAVVGLERALDMILTGSAVGATEALSMGLANRVVAEGKGVEEAMALARQIVGFPQACRNVDRASCYYTAYNTRSLRMLGRESLRGELE
ncbi:enoyl-CoA hydratase/isomerase family protein [Aspergillus mulundensis]|uniref:Enoyl-hydratase isomerase family protein n=1 Tax=Aspergillus mulundensis TaxID=1810919 RepID=A0A3D8QMK9_9EURO|nr:Enoyl-hydratase isomerase family protein [Aspergillus mulundensis]RDW62880.1 Enoyl-hydratase isomerase family protein [Aspergillus mulundensis]